METIEVNSFIENSKLFKKSPLLYCEDDLHDTFEDNNGYDSSSSLISDSDGTLADSDSSVQKKSQVSKSVISETLKNIKNEMKYKIKENIKNNTDVLINKEGQETNELILKEKLNKLTLKVQLLQKEQALLINIIKDHTNESINESRVFNEEYISVDKNIISLIEKDSEYMKQCEEHLTEFINETIRDYNILLAEKEIEVVEHKEKINELNKKIEEKNNENWEKDNSYEELLSEMMEQMKIDEEIHQNEIKNLKEEIKIRDEFIDEVQEQNQIYRNSLDDLFKGLSQDEQETIDSMEDVQKQVIYFKDIYTKSTVINEKNCQTIQELKETLDSKDTLIEELKLKLNEKESIIRDMNDKFSNLQAQNKTFKNLAFEIRASVSEGKKKNEEDLEVLRNIIKRKDEALMFSNDRISSLRKTIDKLNEEVNTQKRKLNEEHSQFRKEFRKMKDIIKDNEEQIENLQGEVEQTEELYRKVKKRVEKYKAKSVNSAKEVKGLWDVIDIREKENDELNKEKERLEEENKEFMKQHEKDIEYLEKVRVDYEEKIVLLKEKSEEESNNKIEMVKKASDEIERELKEKCNELYMEKDSLKNNLEIMTKSVKLLQKDSKALEENNKNLEKSIKLIEKKQREREEYWKNENKKLEMEKNREINILINKSKDLEDHLKKERLQTSTLAKCIRDVNHQEALNIKSIHNVEKNQNSIKTNASLKNFSDRVELYQKVLNKKLMNQKLTMDVPISIKSLRNNQVDGKQVDTIKSKSIKLMNFFQSS
ncbi:hypothetical protein BCR36DRAFT_581720 [Piromyces finnis]|uniref:Uncharacterized protein n=1 Tax=Piromyces finnis TaxID=1754191 RepID=A0A1Y1VFL9_9FUNG|nr:hypothetical protein BCR36DRAFT_581720 [Piromyces finnis]|eukprot:ORX54838.1 hypothetical protein BCR36DRAFT_581720 [Piromyces finnis]